VPLAAGPAWLLRNQPALAPFAKEGVNPPFPRAMFLGLPEHGQADPNDPEYRYVIDGYHGGLSKREVVVHRAVVGWRDRHGEHSALALGGQIAREREPGTFLDLDAPLGRAMDGQAAGARLVGPDGDIEILSVAPPGIPWDQWLRAGLAWVPLIGATLVCSLAMAALVRQQWIVNERLPFPIANAITSFLDEPRPGRRFAPVFSDRTFWIGFTIAAVVLISQGLRAWGITTISIPTNLAEVGPVSLAQVLRGGFWDQAYAGEWGLYQWRVYFSIVAITFFLPSDLSFSMWFFFVATNLVYMALRGSGVPIEMHHASVAGMGGFLVQCLFILWIGRGYYLRLLKAAFVPAADHEIRVGAVYARVLLIGMVALVITLVGMGAQVHHAVLAMLINLGILLVLARLVAEAGIPFVNAPTWWPVNAVIMSVTGVSAPAAALVPLILLGATLCADPRENVLPFAVNAEYLGAKARVPRLPWSALLLAVLAIGTVLSAIAMLVMNYHHDGQSARDGWWPHPLLSGLTPMATAASVGVDPDADTGNYLAYAVGALITGGLGIARLLLSWWPLHPIGYLISMTYATVMIWFSFFLGWMLKTLVMRFGGFALYERLKPLALGLIAGEAVVAGLFLIAGLIMPLLGITMPNSPRFLPG
nr:hypothetical protein [Planctomycetota bacterium]